MDIDRYARIVARAGSRRTAVTGTIGAGLLGFLSLSGAPVTPVRGKKKKKPCKNGKRRCAGTCRNVQTDPANCGRCGETCAVGAICQSGTCTCPAGETDCAGTCKNLLTDPDNCGACGNDCVKDECFHGACGCDGENDCPAACTCGAREAGEAACFQNVTQTTCDLDDQCPPGAVCLVNNKCSTPCVA